MQNVTMNQISTIVSFETNWGYTIKLLLNTQLMEQCMSACCFQSLAGDSTILLTLIYFSFFISPRQIKIISPLSIYRLPWSLAYLQKYRVVCTSRRVTQQWPGTSRTADSSVLPDREKNFWTTFAYKMDDQKVTRQLHNCYLRLRKGPSCWLWKSNVTVNITLVKTNNFFY